jgi:cytochrome bd-type quinol oxidase subunit 2
MKRSYFGSASMVAAILSLLFLGANIGVSQLDITPSTFNSLNNITVLIACSLAPLAILLGFMGFVRKDDSKLFSGIALVLIGVPFLILFVQMISSVLRSN